MVPNSVSVIASAVERPRSKVRVTAERRTTPTFDDTMVYLAVMRERVVTL